MLRDVLISSSIESKMEGSMVSWLERCLCKVDLITASTCSEVPNFELYFSTSL